MRILFLALAGVLMAGPALAGQARGGSPSASTDEYARGSADPNADKGLRGGGMSTADLPRVNIQPTINADGTIGANSNATAQLQAGAKPVTNPPAADGADSAALNVHNAPAAPGGTMGSRGKVGQDRGHGSGLN